MGKDSSRERLSRNRGDKAGGIATPEKCLLPRWPPPCKGASFDCVGTTGTFLQEGSSWVLTDRTSKNGWSVEGKGPQHPRAQKPPFP